MVIVVCEALGQEVLFCGEGSWCLRDTEPTGWGHPAFRKQRGELNPSS